MTVPLSFEEGQSTTRPPRFNGKILWMVEDAHTWLHKCWRHWVWDVILNGPYIPTKGVVEVELSKVIPKTRREYNEASWKKIVWTMKKISCWYVWSVQISTIESLHARWPKKYGLSQNSLSRNNPSKGVQSRHANNSILEFLNEGRWNHARDTYKVHLHYQWT